MEKVVVKGQEYAVVAQTDTTLTAPDGMKIELKAGQQAHFTAQSSTVSADAEFTITVTFNRAARKLRLRAGGVKDELPAGYLRAEFLERVWGSNAAQKINLPVWFNPAKDNVNIKTAHRGFKKDVMCGEGINTPQGFAYGHYMPQDVFYMCGSSYKYKGGFVDLTDEKYHEWQIDSTPSEHKFLIDGKLYYTGAEDLTSLEGYSFALFGMSNATRDFFGKKSYWRLTVNGKTVADFVPAVTAAGAVCFYNKADKKDYRGTANLIVGFTLEQARKLGAHLPAVRGSLTISLPTGYEQDSAVAESLETARAKGWTLTVQTYTPEAEAAAATFGMRRVWVRKQQAEQGGYVDASGTRWSVEWCVDMVTPDGSTPDQHGYELYRSTEAAVAYWELTPWVDPEAEQEFLTTEEQ